MRTSNKIAILIAGMFLTGCLENNGGTEVKEDLNNSDFSVITEPPTQGGDTSGGDGSGDSTGGGTTTPQPVLEGLIINGGATLTASKTLMLEFLPPFHSADMKLTENATCDGGSWSAFVPGRDYISSQANKSVAMSVKFRDHDGRVSECYTSSIFIDQMGPDIVYSKYPSAPVEEGLDVEIIFNVTDVGAGVATVGCEFAGVSKTCAAGQNKITFPKMAGGDYSFTVSATDKLGHASSKTIHFTVSSMYKQMVQNVQVNEYKKVDILFVIDNSGSMEYEQKNMAQRVQNFLDVVRGLDWQIAVTTTDPRDVTLGDGRLVQLYGRKGQYILNSTMNESDSKYTLGMTLQRPETGSGSEQGIYTTYRAIERSIAGTNSNFIRSDAQLAVVLISDEDESANGMKNDPGNLISYIQSAFNGQKAFSFHSVISRPDDQVCLKGEGYSMGHRYAQISKLTGGVIGDVCAADYAAQVQGIAEGVRKTLKTITLACEPVIDSMRSVLVLKDGQVYSGTRSVQGVNVVFDDMLPQGNYEVYYSCVR